MFIQVFQGMVRDEAELRRLLERWDAELAPGATGYLGSTAGLCDDGTFVVMARFESAEAARANSARPEQGAWWAEAEKCFDGDVTFMDSTDVRQLLAGGSDDARFVQIMEGRTAEFDRMYDLMDRHAAEIHEARPEIIGALMVDVGDGRFVDAVYFTTEEAARRGEQAEMPDALRADMEESTRLMNDVRFLDLHEPMLISPRR